MLQWFMLLEYECLVLPTFDIPVGLRAETPSRNRSIAAQIASDACTVMNIHETDAMKMMKLILRTTILQVS